jgi:hypothetical protein
VTAYAHAAAAGRGNPAGGIRPIVANMAVTLAVNR